MQLWQLIPIETRIKLKAEHKLKASNSVEISNNAIVRDGIGEQDLKDLDKNILLKELGFSPILEDEKEEIGEKIEEPKEEVKKTEEKTTTAGGLNKYFVKK